VPRPTALNVAWREIQALAIDADCRRISYGPLAEQFGELRLPKSGILHAVVVFIHGGCWLNKFGVDHVTAISRALANQGYAVWSPEYRRVGDAGGGWPGTFEDISRSVQVLSEFAGEYGLRLDRVIVMGHSAGGHLALWLAGQRSNRALPVRGVISLAGIADLLAYEELANECASSLPRLLGGSSRQQPERWAEADPLRLMPFGVPATFIHGEFDEIVPLSQSENAAKATGGALHVVKGGGHFDMVSPYADAFQVICKALEDI
jgi:acetyl esterase/lipase